MRLPLTVVPSRAWFMYAYGQAVHGALAKPRSGVDVQGCFVELFKRLVWVLFALFRSLLLWITCLFT